VIIIDIMGDGGGESCERRSVGSALHDVEAHLAWVSCLDLALDAVQFPPEPVLGAGVQHLAPGPRSVRRPIYI
jgi:hypothetical protein